jgi:two-component system, cell cycle response regulator CpdR
MVELTVSRVVLAVDDDPMIVDLMQCYLQELGCEVVTATSPHEALKILAADRRIKILITDIQMSPMDGYEVAEKAKRMRPELGIIFASGRGEGRDDLPS